MSDAMHRQGINMRYLGYIHKKLSEKQDIPTEKEQQVDAGLEFLSKGNFKHLRHIVEREVVVRSAKHVLNRILKEESTQSSLHIASTVAHLLNCLFASP